MEARTSASETSSRNALPVDSASRDRWHRHENGERVVNFVFIMTDTYRYDHLGLTSGGRIKSPNLDAFATDGVLFQEARAGSFPTVPNRYDIMTGRYGFPWRGWEPLPKDVPVLAQLLGANGYRTQMVIDAGNLVLGGVNYDRGFQGWHWIRGNEGDNWTTGPRPPEVSESVMSKTRPGSILDGHLRATAGRRYERDTFVAQTMQWASDWLEDTYTNWRDQPFLLYVDTFDPHEPWDAPMWYLDLYGDPDFKGDWVTYPDYTSSDILTEEELEHCRHMYAAECTLVDTWIGRLLDKIEQLGLYDDTVVFITSDHGFCIGDHGLIGKCALARGRDRRRTPLEPWPIFTEVSHILFMAKGNGVVGGRRSANLVQPVDFLPTILDLAGIPAPEGVHGLSLAGELSGNASDAGRELAVTSGGLRYVSAPTTGTYAALPAITDGEWYLATGGRFRKAKLYHMPDDPLQENDLRAERPEIAKALHTGYMDWLRKIGCGQSEIDAQERWDGD